MLSARCPLPLGWYDPRVRGSRLALGCGYIQCSGPKFCKCILDGDAKCSESEQFLVMALSFAIVCFTGTDESFTVHWETKSPLSKIMATSYQMNCTILFPSSVSATQLISVAVERNAAMTIARKTRIARSPSLSSANAYAFSIVRPSVTVGLGSDSLMFGSVSEVVLSICPSARPALSGPIACNHFIDLCGTCQPRFPETRSSSNHKMSV